MNRAFSFDRQERQREQQQDQQRHLYFLFERVVSAYNRVSELPLLTAMNYDPDSPQQHTLARASLDYKLDIEQATEAALDGFPALQAAWLSLATGEKIPAALQRAVVTKCGRDYQQKRLDPHVYFRLGCDELRRGRAA